MNEGEGDHVGQGAHCHRGGCHGDDALKAGVGGGVAGGAGLPQPHERMNEQHEDYHLENKSLTYPRCCETIL